MPLYDAFISYSHAKDKPIAAALQSVIQKLGKPWYRRRALRVFRDDTSLSATPSLWPSIEQALGESRFLVLLASPEAVPSPWVEKEVSFWLASKSAQTLLIALTEGELAWDNASGDFLWRDGTPLPPALKGRFAAEPKWVDLRAYRDGANPRNARFIEAGADLAAAIRGMPKEDLLSQEVRQQRRAVNLALSAAASLLVLAGLAGWQWTVATEQRDRAERTLEAATQTANSLVFDLAQQLRDRAGMPADLVRNILDRARKLQSQLTELGETSPELRRSEAAALIGLADTLYSLGDSKSALEAASRAREILEGLTAIDPANEEWQRWLSVSDNKIGGLLMSGGAGGQGARGVSQRLGDQRKICRNRGARVAARCCSQLQQARRYLAGRGRRRGGARAISQRPSGHGDALRRATPATSNGGAISQSAIPRSAARSWSLAVVTRPWPNIARGSTSTSNPPTRIRATLCGSAISR